MTMQVTSSLNVDDAARQLSELLGRVASKRETILITQSGKPMAMLVPAEESSPLNLADVEGWLEDDDPFFEAVEHAMAQRGRRPSRLGPKA